MASDTKKGRKITIERMPTKKEVDGYIKELKDLKPTGKHLIDLVGLLQDGIRTARGNGVEWTSIADFIKEKTGTDVPAEAVAQSYTTLQRQQQNEGRKEDEPSYADLKHLFFIALDLLAAQLNGDRDVAKAAVKKERQRRQEERQKREEKKKEAVTAQSPRPAGSAIQTTPTRPVQQAPQQNNTNATGATTPRRTIIVSDVRRPTEQSNP